MCDGIGYKVGLLVSVLLWHDFLLCAEGVFDRRSRNSRLSCTDYCGQYIIDIREIIAYAVEKPKYTCECAR
jgi:hypothetical protein